jgi:ribosomal protein S18 acetylase RimI-like enzyme
VSSDAPYTIRAMTIADYPAVLALMKRTPGVSIRASDAPELTARFLERNPGLSFVAFSDGVLIGCVQSSHDGRRGFMQHLAVDTAHRRKGIANALVQQCLDALAAAGVFHINLDVFRTNTQAKAYWAKHGWTLRDDIERFTLIRTSN